MSLYDILIELSTRHVKIKYKDKKYSFCNSVKFDYKTKSISIGSLKIMQNGKLKVRDFKLSDGTQYTITSLIDEPEEDFYEIIRHLFRNYYHSVPTKYDMSCKSLFKAKASDDLSLTEIKNNMPRTEARVLLEGYIMLYPLCNKVIWNNPSYYYYQDPVEKRLVLFKDWIESEVA